MQLLQLLPYPRKTETVQIAQVQESALRHFQQNGCHWRRKDYHFRFREVVRRRGAVIPRHRVIQPVLLV